MHVVPEPGAVHVVAAELRRHVEVERIDHPRAEPFQVAERLLEDGHHPRIGVLGVDQRAQHPDPRPFQPVRR